MRMRLEKRNRLKFVGQCIIGTFTLAPSEGVLWTHSLGRSAAISPTNKVEGYFNRRRLLLGMKSLGCRLRPPTPGTRSNSLMATFSRFFTLNAVKVAVKNGNNNNFLQF